MEQRGKLFTAILACAAGEGIPDLDPLTDMAFSFISAQIERDMVKVVTDTGETGRCWSEGR